MTAVGHLGNQMVEVRLGGIYALEPIARESDRERETIADILAGFVRGHAHAADNARRDEIASPTADVKAAITVLARIVPRTAPFTQYNSQLYNDPNVVCEPSPRRFGGPSVPWVARWNFVKLNAGRIEGWIPRRSPAPTEKPCSNIGDPFPGGE